MSKSLPHLCVAASILLVFGMACKSSPQPPAPSPGSDNDPEYSSETTGTSTAYSEAPESAPSGLNAQGTSSGEEQLDAFARAYLDLAGLQDEYAPKLQSAQSEDTMRALQEQLNQESATAIKAHGLTMQEFDEINQATATDATLRDQIQRRVLKLQLAQKEQ